VDDREPKYGLVVYGEVRQDSLWKVTGARPGDLLLLTKPVGTGIVATAVKADMVEDEASRTEAARWMTTLNDLPRRLSPDECRMVHACTDVTGFGLAGHALDMLSEGGLKLTLGIRDIPLLPGVLGLASSGLIPAGTYSNRIAYEDRVKDPSKHDDILMDRSRRPDFRGAAARPGKGGRRKAAPEDPELRLRQDGGHRQIL
jgi:selenide,water dikinase